MMEQIMQAVLIGCITGALSSALTLAGIKVELRLLSRRVDRVESRVFPIKE